MDLFLIEDSQPKPSKVSSLTYIGKFDEKEFQLLQEHSIIEKRFDYYKDLRLTQQQVRGIYYRLCELRMAFEFENLIKLAVEKQLGILGYAD